VLEVGIDFVVKEWTEDGEWVPSLSAAKKYVIKKQADWEKQHGEEAEPEKVDERTGPARHTSELQPGIKEIAHGIVTLDGMVDGAGRLTTSGGTRWLGCGTVRTSASAAGGRAQTRSQAQAHAYQPA